MQRLVVTFVTYNNGTEVLVTLPGYQEQYFIQEFFTEGGRVLEDYDREEITDCGVRITPGLRSE